MTRTLSEQKRPHGREVLPRELVDLLPSLVVVLDADGRIVEVNKYAGEILKSSGNKLFTSLIYDLLIDDERERIRTLVHECLRTCKTLFTQTKLHSGVESSIDLDISLSCYPPRKRVADRYCVLIGRDITEEKQKELDLLRFSNIAYYTINPLEITDAQGRIIYVNPAFEKASGYSKEELIGKNPNTFGSGKHPRSFWKNMWDTIKAGNVWVGEIENRRRTGEPFFTHILISPIIDSNANVVGYFGVHRDITGQKHLEKQLVHAQKMESIGMLAAGLAHEVGNPLTSISSLVQVIQRETKEEFTKDKLALIKSQITRISRIIRDLVDFSRRSSYEVQLTDINEIVNQAVEIVRVGKKAKEILFEVNLHEKIPTLPLVPDQIEQVFINVLINAVDAIYADLSSSTRLTGKTKSGNIVVTSLLVDADVVITIADNGKGISEEFVPKIFEPFFTTKKVGEGTGLGLWVSYGIIKSFQGTINVTSVENNGTTFTITLPLHSVLS